MAAALSILELAGALAGAFVAGLLVALVAVVALARRILRRSLSGVRVPVTTLGTNGGRDTTSAPATRTEIRRRGGFR